MICGRNQANIFNTILMSFAEVYMMPNFSGNKQNGNEPQQKHLTQQMQKKEMKTKSIRPKTKGPRPTRWILGLGAAGLFSLTMVEHARAQATTNAPTPPPYGKRANEPFWKRFDQAELEQAGTASNPPPDTNAPPSPTRRIGPTPFDSPPFPDMDWQLGGGPNVIGDPGALRDSPWPLMQALYDGPHGKAWYDSRIQVYGWWTVSGNISSSHNYSAGPTPNFPEVYDERSDRVEMDQFVTYIERMADENQTDHIDWGFRLALLFGLDYRFMASRGYLNDENLLVNNHFGGFDTPMMYFNIYIPKIAEGENIIIGRIISQPDIEQQLAPNNLMMSHSLVYSFDNYTMWGIWSGTKLSDRWLLQVGLADGVDIAPWETQDPGDQPTGSVLVQYISPGGHDSFYLGDNSFNNTHWGFNNLQESIASYTHKFNDTWWTAFEAQYMYMDGNHTGPTKSVPYQDGFFTVHNGFVAEGGVVNYTEYRFAPNAFLSIRNEWWDDGGGSRTGYASAYDENAIGITYFPNKLIFIRPEIRFEHAFTHNGLASSSAAFNTTGAPETVAGPYDSGTKQSQVTFGMDITYHF
jgi:hypothetical protein